MHGTCLKNNSGGCVSVELEGAPAEADRPARGEGEPLNRFLEPSFAARDRGDWKPPHLGVRLKSRRDVTSERQFGCQNSGGRCRRGLPGVGDGETARRVERDALFALAAL